MNVHFGSALILSLLPLADLAEAQTYSGYQTIEGTEVYTEIFESEGYARFSNDCGSQELTQSELQAGAIPYDIIPCPREDTSSDDGYSSGDDYSSSEGKPCGGGICPWGTICTQENTCLDILSPRVCLDVESYCDAGFVCTSDNECLSLDSPRACSDGSYCSEGDVCAPDGFCVSADDERYCGGGSFCADGYACHSSEGNCVPVDAERYCGDGRFCDAGMQCDRSMEAGSARCYPEEFEETEAPEDVDDPDSSDKSSISSGLYISLVATPTGKSFGIGIDAKGSYATLKAKAICEAYKLNASTTAEDRMEPCNKVVVVQDGCVSLARSHDMYWGPEETFAMGMATGKPLSAATGSARNECINQSGQSCSIIPEASQCSDRSLED